MTETGPKEGERQQTIALTGIPSGEAFGTPAIQTRHYIALQHLWNARHAARLCSEREATIDRNDFQAVRGLSMNAVISAAASIETIVNEVFANVADTYPGDPRREGLADGTVETMRRLWKGPDSIERASALTKYQIGLTAARKALMDTGRPPYQDAALLVSLRDLLMHYKPQWQGDRPLGIENKLRNKSPTTSSCLVGRGIRTSVLARAALSGRATHASISLTRGGKAWA
jgi:hypothetical protein